MTAFSFSYAPKASTALASINPIQNRGEGLRFAANTPMSFLKQNPEIVTEGFWKGRQALTEGVVKGVTSALSGVSGALTQKAADAKADAKLKEDRAHEIAIANIKATPTEAEKAYQQQRSDLLTQQIAAATAKNEADKADDGFNAIPSGTIDWSSYNRKDFKTPVSEMPAATVPTSTPSSAPPAPAAPATPPAAPAGVSQRSIFGRNNNPNFVSVRDAIKNRSVAAAPTEPNLFSNISAVTPEPMPEGAGFSLSGLELPQQQQQYQLPESAGEITLAGEELPLMPVSGAESKPLAGTPPPVEPALPQAVPNEPAQPALAQAVPETEAEYRYRVENDLTGQAFMSPADARMAKNILEQQLGVKAKVNGIDAGKGKRIYRVEIVEDAPSPMESIPEGMVMKQVTDKDGNLTTTYIPKVPVKQQIAAFDNSIEKAKVLKKTITKIKEIAPGYLFAGAGGISGIMKYNPFSNDARTVRKLVDTVKGIVGFDELVALKAAGGSLGALSDSELSMLTSLKGSVDPDLDEKTFLDNLSSIEASTDKLITGLESDKKDVMTVEKKTNFQPIQTPKSEPPKKGDEFYNSKTKQTLIWDGNSYIAK